jgi:plasmid rolling circle replication initiator protein Rep
MPLRQRALLDRCGSGDFLSELSPHDSKWDTHKSSSERVSALYAERGFDSYAERISECGDILEFNLERLPDSAQFKLRLKSTWLCRCRHCPVCQWRRVVVRVKKFREVLPKILTAYPTHRFVFLTLTLETVKASELRERISTLNKAWQRLSQRKSFPAVGWIKTIEVTRRPEGKAHPHIHATLMVKPSYFTTGYIPHEQWRSLWQKSARVDYLPQVRIQAVKPKKDKPYAETVEDAIVAGLLETVKYQIKPEDWEMGSKSGYVYTDGEWLEIITQQLHKTRAYAVGGVFREFLSDEEPEDLIGEGDDEDADILDKLFYGWRYDLKRYTQLKIRSEAEMNEDELE